MNVLSHLRRLVSHDDTQQVECFFRSIERRLIASHQGSQEPGES
jgi:hypothetical protein